jgi:hypothetical protein
MSKARNNAAALMEGWAAWTDAGCLVHPAKADGSKNPVSFEGGSNELDENGRHVWGYGRIRDGELPAVCFEQFGEMVKAGSADGFGVFCGAPSGELEMLEVEGRAVKLLAKVKRYADELGDNAPAVLDRVSHGCVQQSPSDGIHFIYRVAGTARGNTPLAARPDVGTKNGRVVLAETRGAGGWFVAAPSGGRTHKSGKPYVLLRGSPATIPTLTADERDTLYTLFRLLDEMPAEAKAEKRPHRARKSGEPLRPGDDFNAHGNWETILKGWKKGKNVGGRQHWARPGKDKGTSATTTENVLCCFSTSAGLPVFDPETGENGLCKFSVYAALHHNGDFSAAASALRHQGFGDEQQTSEKKSTASLARVESVNEQQTPDTAAKPHRRLVLKRASEIECSEINWLWPQRIVGDGLTIITGPVGISKSLISVDVTARVTTGGKWPDATGHAPQGSVILFGAEDDAGKVVVPRLMAASADLSRVHVCQGTIDEHDCGDDGEQSPEIAAMILERHIGELRAALDDVADCRLIVFDPLPDYIAADENKSAEVRAALVPLARLAQERNVAVVAVAHQNKKNDLTTVQRIAGSSAFAQIARVVLSIGTHPEDADKQSGKRRVMLVSKNNYGERDVGQAYSIETRASGQPGLVWQPGMLTMDADEIARRPTGGREHEGRRGEAVDALRDLLSVGEQSAAAVTARLQDTGLGRRQIDHAANALNVIKTKRRDGWYWRLPVRDVDDATPQPEPAFAAWAPDEIEQFNST